MAKSLTRWARRNRWTIGKWNAGLEVPRSWIKKYKYVRSIINPTFRDFGKFRYQLILFRNYR